MAGNMYPTTERFSLINKSKKTPKNVQNCLAYSFKAVLYFCQVQYLAEKMQYLTVFNSIQQYSTVFNSI